jgi:hypothetical protein
MSRYLKALGVFVAGMLAASVLMPQAVHAASSVFTIVGPGITDQAKGAKVSGGSLRVGDGAGPLTVDGTVSAAPVAPADPFTSTEDVNGTFNRLVGPTSNAISVTSLSVSPVASPINFFIYAVTVPTGNACNDSGNWNTFFTLYHLPSIGAPFTQAFPTPMRISAAPPGLQNCLLGTTGGPAGVANSSGFYG